jgi:Protein of unknown function (DUF3107)
VDVRIGLIQNAKEIELDMSDDTDAEQLRSQVEKAIIDGASLLWLTDKKGRSTAIVLDKLAWMEVGADTGRGRIGFGA